MLAWLVAAAAVVSASGPVDSRCTARGDVIRIRVTVPSPSFEKTAEIIRTTVEEIWTREGLRVRWIDSVAPDLWSDTDFWIAALEQLHVAGGALGAVQFHGGAPRPLARLSIDDAVDWVCRYQSARFAAPVPLRPLRQMAATGALVDRVLGLAAAHELGHFVLASKEHAGTGVMQDVYRRPRDLTNAASWRLDDVSRARLNEQLAHGGACARRPGDGPPGPRSIGR